MCLRKGFPSKFAIKHKQTHPPPYALPLKLKLHFWVTQKSIQFDVRQRSSQTRGCKKPLVSRWMHLLTHTSHIFHGHILTTSSFFLLLLTEHTSFTQSGVKGTGRAQPLITAFLWDSRARRLCCCRCSRHILCWSP